MKIWKKIKGSGGYEISNQKEVRNGNTGKILKKITNKYGKENVYLNGFIKSCRSVDKLYREAFEAEDESY